MSDVRDLGMPSVICEDAVRSLCRTVRQNKDCPTVAVIACHRHRLSCSPATIGQQ